MSPGFWTGLSALYILFTVPWVICGLIGVGIGTYRWFFARMLLLTPIWPAAAVAWGGPATVRFVIWLIARARLS